jgi:hypothetical protein
MMKKPLYFAAIALAIILCVCSPAVASTSNSQQLSTISTPHTYSVLPGSAEWETYYTPEQKLAACRVDPDELARMTTPALVETVLTYPLLGDMFAFGSTDIGIRAVASRFAGIYELCSRGDALEALRARRTDMKAIGLDANLSRSCADALLRYLEHARAGGVGDIGILATQSYVYTPNGTAVQTIRDYTWADHGTTYNDALAWSYYYCEVYPSAYILVNPAPKYNCHSYAWYSTSTTNPHWMNNPGAYMTDGSYVTCTIRVGAKVYYNASPGLDFDHSGIVQSIASGGVPARVKSKWGCLATFSHYVTDCVYMNYSPTITYWKRP